MGKIVLATETIVLAAEMIISADVDTKVKCTSTTALGALRY